MMNKDKEATYAEKIYTVNGVTQENICTHGEKILHIGPGKRALLGAKTIDILNLSGVDIVHDLDIVPWPFKDNEFDLIFAHSVFEHLDKQIAVMEEMWRILKPKGRIVITVPHFRCTDAFTDSTHRHFFTTQSMDYYIKTKALSNYQYTTKNFLEKGFWFGWPQQSKNPFTRLFKWFIKRYPRFYDSHLSLLFPVKIIIWELEAVKE
ncbi:MAG: class I SAM-dependent methyltransferase [Candidatus Pacebacteria bacterium]|nr:class I SAM-dependent methyltransferase [Candidatus Paceibacterota bacterium]MCF7856941.1 class I SAM-dependent methyltransferase [Candidatus Paceibacterota bacterium]